MKMKTVIFLLMAGFYLLAGFGSAQAAASQVYKIQRVASDDALNMRATAGVKGGVVATIPFNGTGVVSTGAEQKLGSSTWVEIQWSGKSGWVNKYYLAEDVQVADSTPAAPVQADAAVSAQPVATVAAAPQAAAQTEQAAGASIFMRCGGTEPFWSMHVKESLLVVKIMDGPEYTTPVEFRKQSENNTSIAVVAGRKGGQGTLTAAFLQKVDMCSDGMSDKNYPYAITAMLDGARAMSGCCEMSGGQ